MLTVNHLITAGILAFLMAFSPMSIGMFYGNTTPTVATLTFSAH